MAGPTLSIGTLESIAPTADFAELGSFGRVHFAWSRENVGRAKALVAASAANVTEFARKSRSRYFKVCVAKHLPISDARKLLYTIVLGRTTVA